MKILSLQYGNPYNPYSHGGLSSLLHETFKRLVPQHQVTCLTGLIPGKNGPVEKDGVRYIQVGAGTNKYANRLSFSLKHSFYSKTLHQGYDIILVPWDRYAPVPIPAVKNCPVVLELCLEFFSIPSKLKPVEPLTRALLKKQLAKCNYLISMSEGVLRVANKFTGDVRLTEILPGGVSGDLFQYPIGDCAEDYLLFLGRLDISHKGIDILLKSYKKANVGVPLIIAGDGVDRKEVEKLVSKYNLSEKVKLAGWVKGSAKYELIKNSIALCIPSRVEGWGIVASEAAAMGKPVIGTKVIGLEESVEDGKTGILVQRDNSSAFAKAMEMLVQDKVFRRLLGDHARESVKQFTWERIAEKRLNFFQKVIDDFKRKN